MSDVIYLDILGKEYKLFKRLKSMYHVLYDFEIKNLYILFNYRVKTICGEILCYIEEDESGVIKIITSYKEIFFVTGKDIINIGTKEKIEQDLIFL